MSSGRFIALSLVLLVSCADEPRVVDLNVKVDVRVPTPVRCPVVTGISVLPLNIQVGHELALEAFTSAPVDRLRWRSGSQGSFSAPRGAVTMFRCPSRPGPRELEVSVTRHGCPESKQRVEVECEPRR